MPNKLTRLLKPDSIGLAPNQNAIILKRDIFPQVDAGKIDAFIEQRFPNLISRAEGQVNGVSVTKDEIVITLANPISESQINSIISLLETNF